MPANLGLAILADLAPVYLPTPQSTDPNNSPTEAEFPRAKDIEETNLLLLSEAANSIEESARRDSTNTASSSSSSRPLASDSIKDQDKDAHSTRNANEEQEACSTVIEYGQSAPLPKIPIATFYTNGRVVRLSANEGDAVHLLARERILKLGSLSKYVRSLKKTWEEWEREQRETTVDERSTREWTVDPDATESEREEEEKVKTKAKAKAKGKGKGKNKVTIGPSEYSEAGSSRVQDPDATESEPEEEEKEKAMAKTNTKANGKGKGKEKATVDAPAKDNEAGLSQRQHTPTLAEPDSLPSPPQRSESKTSKLAAERRANELDIAKLRQLCIERGIDPNEPIGAAYYVRVGGHDATLEYEVRRLKHRLATLEHELAIERTGSANQASLEKQYPRVPQSDGTLEGNQRFVADIMGKRIFRNREGKVAANHQRLYVTAQEVRDESCQMSPKYGLFHGDADRAQTEMEKAKEKATRVRAESPISEWGQDEEYWQETIRKAEREAKKKGKGKASPQKNKVVVTSAAPAVRKPVRAAAPLAPLAVTTRKRSADTAALEIDGPSSISLSPLKKAKLLKLKLSPQSDPTHPHHATHEARRMSAGLSPCEACAAASAPDYLRYGEEASQAVAQGC
jgi:hypothetical protein